MAMYGCVGLYMAMYGYVWLCRAVFGYVGLCRAMFGYVGLCKAIERNVFHILANGEPVYDAYTTYLPTHARQMLVPSPCSFLRLLAIWHEFSLSLFSPFNIVLLSAFIFFIFC